MAVPGNSVNILSQSWQLSLICYCINNSWAGLKDFFPSRSLSFFFFIELIIHSTLFLHHGNWFSHKSNDFFFFLASFEISRKDVSIQFHPFCAYKFFRLWFVLWSKCFDCQLTSLKFTQYDWQLFPMYIYIFINKFCASGVLCLARLDALRDHMIMM